MEGLIVGSKDCPINDIVIAIISNDDNLLWLAKNWVKLATVLKVPAIEIHELEQDLLVKHKNVIGVVTHLLHSWKQQKSEEAKFATLLNILEHECDFRDLAELLWKRLIREKMTENVTWADLDERSRKKIMESQVISEMHRQQGSMRELCDLVKDPELLLAGLSGYVILQILDSQLVTIPSQFIPALKMDTP